jgi:hypothetical protein
MQDSARTLKIGNVAIPVIPRTSARPCHRCGEPLYVHNLDGDCQSGPRREGVFEWTGEDVFIVPVNTCCGELPGEGHRYDLHKETDCHG